MQKPTSSRLVGPFMRALALTVTACAMAIVAAPHARPDAPQEVKAPQRAIVALSADASELRARFNRDRSRVRLLMLLSPS